MALVSALFEILRGPTIGNVFTELLLFLGPLWVAVLVGVLVGWAWKPKWANLGRDKLDYTMSKASSLSAGFISPPTLSFSSMPGFNSMKAQLPSCISWISDNGAEKETFSASPTVNSDCSSSQIEREKPLAVTGEDLEHLSQLVEVTDGGPAWIQMMDRSTQNMSYQAWRRDPETGPPQYRSRTIFEDATPEMVRDFFWDDDFRQSAKWDDMLIHSKILEECPDTGTMVVQWIRKFPFFCSDREYIIGRRIWESGRSYYCVTKGVPCTYMPRHNKPRRVDLYYSSWCIRAAESKNGQMTACEVLLFHHEDMGIPWEIAKLGVRQGMWGAVKKIEPGLRAYQKARLSGEPLSKCASMAHINTKVNANYLKSLENGGKEISEVETPNSSDEKKPVGRNIPKLLFVGGAVVLACSLDKGLLTKAVIFGVARRFGKIGRRL
ncbi:START domain [Macleaya cordata]|uniref:START domain n=1 Tax=Macleaya cordata TaxID=56857 RepID=A0A200Q2K5_MACCD|nr:START domain [Macleaya cordata]